MKDFELTLTIYIYIIYPAEGEIILDIEYFQDLLSYCYLNRPEKTSLQNLVFLFMLRFCGQDQGLFLLHTLEIYVRECLAQIII